MNNEKSPYAQVEEFIFDDESQNLLSQINSNVMNFNILDITGMGNQEIKHSNILSWMFGDNEHGLGYEILECFLKKIIESSSDNTKVDILKHLKHYVYLPKKKEDFTIYREKNNIDLLLVDKSNKFVIAIENKVYHSERVGGNGGGQLTEYYNIVNRDYDEDYKKFFVYLTIDKVPPSSKDNKKNWMVASHQMVGEVVEDLLNANNLNDKTELILSSYVDLLKRRNIMANKKLEELCEKIWAKNEKALDILFEYRKTDLDRIYDLICEGLDFYDETIYIKTSETDKLYKKILGTEWTNSEKNVIDIQVINYEKNGYIWIGYYFPNKQELNNEILNKICERLEVGKNQKEKEDKEIMRITKQDIETNSDSLKKIADKYIKTVKEEINRFKTIVNEVLEKDKD